MKKIVYIIVALALVLSFGNPDTAKAVLSADERQALVDLYNNTDGANWSLSANWLTGDPCVPAWRGVTCNWENTTVTHLQLNTNNLNGGIPPAIGNLTALQYLYLGYNQLTSIPAELGNLTALQRLGLYNNQLTSIPVELGNLTALQRLELSSNQLTSIPAELGNMTNLRYLYLESNQLTSIPVELGNLTNLTYLYLGSNQLTGEVPASIMNTALFADGGEFGYNALYSTNWAVFSFLESKQVGGNWYATQSLAPTYPSASVVSDTSIDIFWTPDTYAQAGGYEIWSSTDFIGPYAWIQNTVDKTIINTTVTDLTPGTGYFFKLRTWTDPHANNDNKVTSDYSDEAYVKTTGIAPSGGGGGDDDGGGGGGGCFIATAAYGSYADEHVMALREFRDEYLLTNPAGRELVKAYYAYSPPIADFIAERPALRVATRMALAPVVYTVKHPGAALVLMGFVVAGTGVAVRRRRRGHRPH